MRTHKLLDVQALRERARKHIEDAAVTQSYGSDRVAVIEMLNAALATEIVCNLRYRRHHFMASGLHAESVATEFLEHAQQEQEHADSIAARIVQLGGEPDFAPSTLEARSHAEYVAGNSLLDMIRENLIAERIAIESYTEVVRFLGNDDPTTRVMLEKILAVEEEHAEDMGSLLAGLASREPSDRRVSQPDNGARIAQQS